VTKRGRSLVRQAEIPGTTRGLPDTHTGVTGPGASVRAAGRGERRCRGAWMLPSLREPHRGPFLALINPKLSFPAWGGACLASVHSRTLSSAPELTVIPGLTHSLG